MHQSSRWFGVLAALTVAATVWAGSDQPRNSERPTVYDGAAMNETDAKNAAESMRRNGVSLSRAISAAESHTNGSAIGAKWCNESGKGVIDVCVVDRQGNVSTVTIDGASGNVLASHAGFKKGSNSNNEVRTAGVTRRAERLVRADEVLGTNVKNTRDESIGEIEDLAIDVNNGKVLYGVLSFGGFAGVNDKYFAVPWTSFSTQTGRTYILDMDKERLKNAPGFDKKHWPDMAQPEFSSDIGEFYGRASLDDDEVRYDTRPIHILKASDLIGRKVVNPQNEKLGDVHSLAIDPRTGRVRYLVLESGGFLGIKERLYAVPWSAVKHETDKCVIDVNKETLDAAPNFEKSSWPDLTDRQWAERTHNAYRATPYWDRSR